LINLKEELQNYPTINLKALVEDESQIPDNIKNSIELYNKAIESIKIDSEDIAIIELKKAIAENPDFYEAMNLLGLCYIYANEKEKAIEIFKNVIAAENNSIKALGYLNKLGVSGSMQADDDKKKKTATPVKKIEKTGSMSDVRGSGKAVKKKKSSGFIKFIVGFAAGFLVMLVISLVVPPGDAPDEDLKAQYEGMITSYETKYNNLKAEYDDLKAELEAANKELDYRASVDKLNEIEKLISKKDYQQAADMLLLMGAVEFKEEDKARYESLYNEAMPRVASDLLNKGIQLCEAKNYEEALKNLEKIETYMKDFDRIDAALYYAGKSYQGLNNTQKAKELYNRIINEYPQSRYVQYSRYRLNEM